MLMAENSPRTTALLLGVEAALQHLDQELLVSMSDTDLRRVAVSISWD